MKGEGDQNVQGQSRKERSTEKECLVTRGNPTDQTNAPNQEF